MSEITEESLRAEFPDWEPFRGTDRRWHARIREAEPPVTVHDDDLEGLREEILRENSRSHQRAWARGNLL